MSTSLPAVPPAIAAQSGIYRITCLPTGKVYVGSAVNLRRRHRRHWFALGAGKHRNAHLQAAWNKYGADAFVFNVIEPTDISGLLSAEQRHLDAEKAADRRFGFNVCPTAGNSLGRKPSAETRAKLAAASAGHVPTDDARRKLSEAMRGRVFSPEHKAKIGAASRWNTNNLGKRFSAAHRARIGAALRGKPKKESARARMSIAKIGNKNCVGRVLSPENLAKMLAGRRAAAGRRAEAVGA